MGTRDALNTGMMLGTDRVRKQVEELSGVPQHQLKRGPRQAEASHSRS